MTKLPPSLRGAKPRSNLGQQFSSTCPNSCRKPSQELDSRGRISPEQMFVIGTAGHVDHGKSALVRALTGIDPDRLPEEKAREMTIDLGFAWLALQDGNKVGIVDVPGHERFIKNMIAGA